MFVKLLNLPCQFSWIYTFSLGAQTIHISANNHDDDHALC